MSISSSDSFTPIPQRKPWTTKEDELLTELRKNNNLDWIEVARRIDGRNPSYSACIKNIKEVGQILIITDYSIDIQTNRYNISRLYTTKANLNPDQGQIKCKIQLPLTGILKFNYIFINSNYQMKSFLQELQCAQRWKRIKGFKLRKQWTEEENQKLKDLVSKFGYHWSKISSFLPQRTGKQIREHYLNQLHPDINNEPWTKEEDEIVVEFYKKVGGKWSQISKNLNNRSENSIKNRFYSYLRNKYLNIKNPYYIVPEKKQKLNESNSSEEKQEKQMTNPIKQESSFQTNYQQVPVEQNMQLFMPFYQNQFIQYPMAYPCAMFVPIYLYQQQGSQLNQVMRY